LPSWLQRLRQTRKSPKEAQKAGIAYARSNDDRAKYRGRKPTFSCEQFARARDLLNQGIGLSAIAKTVGVNRQSVYRIRSEPEKQKNSRNRSPSKVVLLDRPPRSYAVPSDFQQKSRRDVRQGEWSRFGIVDRRRPAFPHLGLTAIVAATRTCGQICPNRQTPQ
jgi:hypothetical protein